MRIASVLLLLCSSCGIAAQQGSAQNATAAKPIEGLRDNRPNDYALTGARVVVQVGEVIDNATILVQDTSIIAVGSDLEIPTGFMTIDYSGRTIYPALIDAYSEIDVPLPTSKSAGHWNPHITPQREAASVAVDAKRETSKLRGQGIAIRVVAPQGGIVKGSSAVVLLNNAAENADESGRTLLQAHAWQHLQLTVPRGNSKSRYPNSPMGAVALLRQSLYDANWYTQAWQAYRARPELPRPETNIALARLADAIKDETFVADAPNERMALRAVTIANEFSLKMILRGSGREYRELDAIATSGRPVLLPVSFADKPDVETLSAARDTTLQALMHWDLSPENPARLTAAGVPICLTTDGLKDVGKFLKQVRIAVKRGLHPDDALAALTTTPAKLIGIEATTGRIQSGKLANLIVTDGDLFASETELLETWVAGKQYVVKEPDDTEDALVGQWLLQFRADGQRLALHLNIEQEKQKLVGSLVNQSPPDLAESTDDDVQSEEDKPAHAKLNDLVRQRDRMSATVRLQDLDPRLADGLSRLTLLTVEDAADTTTLFGTIALPNGATETLNIAYVAPEAPISEEPIPDNPAPKSEDQADENADGENESIDEPTTGQTTAATPTTETPTPLLYPLGAYGVPNRSLETSTVLFRGATVWTCDAVGTIESADVLIRDGRIVDVGEKLPVPAGCRIIDGRGKHITPGLIDCHTHMGTDGGVNESGQAVTAEVRVGDFIDNSDITIYRQLAGGVTTAHILHGSSNPIGGQNQVIKLRWGQSMDGLRMKQAPSSIKFALGENAKRNPSRYPNTRMGVQEIIRDQLLAAREYDATWRRWRSGDRDRLPPRTDLQLEAMAEVQRGERWIHCHSYRQDEIVATLDVLEEFGIQIGTLHHILEGYKVADRMAKHGAMASAFSDWWAYKFEVFDAIPYNGAIMHDQGVVVSFNSDDRELGRHLNTEAAKAVKYGGVSLDEALKFVTLNPAKQLRIEQHVGSITPGKHADLVVWSGPPLSTTTRCEQTWIDGRRYFDLEADAQLRKRDLQLHAKLVQKVLADDEPIEKSDKDADEEDRWNRHDAYCGANGVSGHVHTQWERQR